MNIDTAFRTKIDVPPEGTDGVFSQCWYPICRTEDVKSGEMKGFDFLDGRVIVVRSSDGKARVQTALCPHVGADLSCGDLVNDEVRCAFHHWRYGPDGACTATGIGDPPPKAAKLFNFPTRELRGVIFAFNGEEPLYELPDFEKPDSELVFQVGEIPEVKCDPWIVAANTPDWQHIRSLHGINILSDNPDEIVKWTDHSFTYDFHGEFRTGEPIKYTVGIFGTTLFFQQGYFNGRWLGVMAPMGMPRPGVSRVFFIIAAERGDGSPEALKAAEEQLEFGMNLEKSIVTEDMHILQKIKYRPMTMTKADKLLATFLLYVSKFPRAHHGAALMR